MANVRDHDARGEEERGWLERKVGWCRRAANIGVVGWLRMVEGDQI